MANRKVQLAEDEFYHIYNRGVDKRVIFNGVRDYDRFRYGLYLANSSKPFSLGNILKRKEDKEYIYSIDRSDQLVFIHAYTLMPNHIHLIVSQKQENGISLFMQKLLTGYTMYFNKKYDRTGALFQGTFQSKHIDSDNYLRYLFAYVHANPFSVVTDDIVTIKNMDKVMNFSHSSIMDYRGVERSESAIVETNVFKEEFNSDKKLEEALRDWLHYHEDE